MQTLMWKEFPVCELAPFKAINPNLVPIPLTEANIKNLLEDRQTLSSRENLKAIFNMCNITDQTPQGLMTISQNQSFLDCYWIKTKPEERWSHIKLYDKEFTQNVADAALEGRYSTPDQIIRTTEQNLKGTRAKCYVRREGKLYLRKRMPKKNVKSELKASAMLDALQIPHAKYVAQTHGDSFYSLCELVTDENHELLHYRTLMNLYREFSMGIGTKAFQYLYSLDPVRFLQMIIFDCVVCNSDRNRDNFGLIFSGGTVLGLAPLFDHDACFEASENGHYFVTNMSFAQTLEWVHTQPYGSEAMKPFVACGYIKDYETLSKEFCEEHQLLYSYCLNQYWQKTNSMDPHGFLNYLKTLKTN